MLFPTPSASSKESLWPPSPCLLFLDSRTPLPRYPDIGSLTLQPQKDDFSRIFYSLVCKAHPGLRKQQMPMAQLCIPWLSAGLGLSASCFSPESRVNGSTLTANPQHPQRAQEEELMGRRFIFWDYKIIFNQRNWKEYNEELHSSQPHGLYMTTLAMHYLSHLHYSGFLSFAQVWLVKGCHRRAFFLFPGLCCGGEENGTMWWDPA